MTPVTGFTPVPGSDFGTTRVMIEGGQHTLSSAAPVGIVGLRVRQLHELHVPRRIGLPGNQSADLRLPRRLVSNDDTNFLAHASAPVSAIGSIQNR